MDAHELLLVDLVVRKEPERRLETDHALEPREPRPETEVHALPERYELRAIAGHVEPIRVLEHVGVAVRGSDDHPATLSPKVLLPLLRQELGFKGVIVSDDLEMKAIADNYGIADSAVMAVAAGCDQLLICHQPSLVDQAHKALVDAVAAGRLPADRLFDAAERVAQLKQRYVLEAPPIAEGPVADQLPSADAVLAMLIGPSVA